MRLLSIFATIGTIYYVRASDLPDDMLSEIGRLVAENARTTVSEPDVLQDLRSLRLASQTFAESSREGTERISDLNTIRICGKHIWPLFQPSLEPFSRSIDQNASQTEWNTWQYQRTDGFVLDVSGFSLDCIDRIVASKIDYASLTSIRHLKISMFPQGSTLPSSLILKLLANLREAPRINKLTLDMEFVPSHKHLSIVKSFFKAVSLLSHTHLELENIRPNHETLFQYYPASDRIKSLRINIDKIFIRDFPVDKIWSYFPAASSLDIPTNRLIFPAQFSLQKHHIKGLSMAADQCFHLTKARSVHKSIKQLRLVAPFGECDHLSLDTLHLERLSISTDWGKKEPLGSLRSLFLIQNQKATLKHLEIEDLDLRGGREQLIDFLDGNTVLDSLAFYRHSAHSIKFNFGFLKYAKSIKSLTIGEYELFSERKFKKLTSQLSKFIATSQTLEHFSLDYPRLSTYIDETKKPAFNQTTVLWKQIVSSTVKSQTVTKISLNLCARYARPLRSSRQFVAQLKNFGMSLKPLLTLPRTIYINSVPVSAMYKSIQEFQWSWLPLTYNKDCFSIQF